MEEPREVELGMKPNGDVAHEYTIVPQRHQRVERQLLGKDGVFSDLDQITQLSEGASGLGDLITMVGDRIYDVLQVFIPDLMEKWEFQGYGSADAANVDEYAEHLDSSPTIPQITEALNAAIDVNGLRFVGKLKDFFDPKLLRAELNATMARWAAEQRKQLESGTGTQPTSPPENGASASTSSSPTDPTPETAGALESPSASPSPDSPS